MTSDKIYSLTRAGRKQLHNEEAQWLPPKRPVESFGFDIANYSPSPDGPAMNTDYFQTVMSDYFDTMGIPIVQGGGFRQPTRHRRLWWPWSTRRSRRPSGRDRTRSGNACGVVGIEVRG